MQVTEALRRWWVLGMTQGLVYQCWPGMFSLPRLEQRAWLLALVVLRQAGLVTLVVVLGSVILRSPMFWPLQSPLRAVPAGVAVLSLGGYQGPLA